MVTVGMGCDHAHLPVSTINCKEIDLMGSFRYANTVSSSFPSIMQGLQFGMRCDKRAMGQPDTACSLVVLHASLKLMQVLRADMLRGCMPGFCRSVMVASRELLEEAHAAPGLRKTRRGA